MTKKFLIGLVTAAGTTLVGMGAGVVSFVTSHDMELWSASVVSRFAQSSVSGCGRQELLFDSGGTLVSAACRQGKTPSGAYVLFHRNGLVARIESYHRGVPTGCWFVFDPGGSILQQACFIDGELISGSWHQIGER
jgi:hypothetical protein